MYFFNKISRGLALCIKELMHSNAQFCSAMFFWSVACTESCRRDCCGQIRARSEAPPPPGFAQQLVRSLACQCEEHKLCALLAISNLLDDSAAAPILLAAEISQPLVMTLASSHSTEIQTSAALVVTGLLTSSSLCCDDGETICSRAAAQLLAAGIVPALSNMLEKITSQSSPHGDSSATAFNEARGCAIGALFNLSSQRISRADMSDSGVIQHLLLALSCADELTQLLAASAITNLAEDARAASRLLESGALLPLLMLLLESADAQLRYTSAMIVALLAKQRALRVQLVSEGVARPLNMLLRSNHYNEKETAATALARLAIEPANRHNLVACGTPRYLFRLL